MANWVEFGAIVGATGVVVLLMTVRKLTERIDRLERTIDAVYRYAQETDPRHDEERWFLKELDEGQLMSGMHHLDLIRDKRARGERTLNDPILPRDDR
jgi:hypothetical protein